MKKSPPVVFELARPLQVDKISAGGIAEHIVANAKEREALARRFDLLEIKKLEAELSVDHARGKMLAVTGSWSADVVQRCVVTLEPIESHIDSNVNTLFAPPHLLESGSGAPHFDAADDEDAEPIVNGVIDLGELVAQHLAIALDPYPRKPGVALPPIEGGEGEGATVASPFAQLASRPKNHEK